MLQPIARRLFWFGICNRPDALASYAEGSKLPVPAAIRRLIVPTMSRLGARRNKATAAQCRADLADVPGHLDRVDAWIAEGVLGGEQLNVADLQIGPSLRMLATFGDVRPWLKGRPCLALAQRVVPTYTGFMPAGALIP